MFHKHLLSEGIHVNIFCMALSEKEEQSPFLVESHLGDARITALGQRIKGVLQELPLDKILLNFCLLVIFWSIWKIWSHFYVAVPVRFGSDTVSSLCSWNFEGNLLPSLPVSLLSSYLSFLCNFQATVLSTSSMCQTRAITNLTMVWPDPTHSLNKHVHSRQLGRILI